MHVLKSMFAYRNGQIILVGALTFGNGSLALITLQVLLQLCFCAQNSCFAVIQCYLKNTVTSAVILSAIIVVSAVGVQARLMSQALRKLTANASKCNCTILFLNQLRHKVGVVYGNPEVTSGGQALKFYASVRLEVRRKQTVEDAAGVGIGIKVKAKVSCSQRRC